MIEAIVVVTILTLAAIFGARAIYRSLKAQGACSCGMNKNSKTPPCCPDNCKDQ